MKKTYKNPTLLVVKIAPQKMMITSDLSKAQEYSEGGTLSGARGARFSDEDWDEE